MCASGVRVELIGERNNQSKDKLTRSLICYCKKIDNFIRQIQQLEGIKRIRSVGHGKTFFISFPHFKIEKNDFCWFRDESGTLVNPAYGDLVDSFFDAIALSNEMNGGGRGGVSMQ